MKKTYIQPETAVLLIPTANMICTSPSLQNGGSALGNNITSADIKAMQDLDDFNDLEDFINKPW